MQVTFRGDVQWRQMDSDSTAGSRPPPGVSTIQGAYETANWSQSQVLHAVDKNSCDGIICMASLNMVARLTSSKHLTYVRGATRPKA